MNLEKLQNRNPAMDILRIVAVLCVISIHFFYHTGYYNTTADNVPMYFATVLRTLFSVCVPLFMILSGFLLCNKTLKKRLLLRNTKNNYSLYSCGNRMHNL